MAKKRYVLIDYIKAICVVLVILTHSDFLNDAMLDKKGLFYLLGVNKAVPAFMFLSGYVYAKYNGGELIGEYYTKKLKGRFLRLFIPALITYAVFVLLCKLSSEGICGTEIIRRFVVADYGKGSYYFHIMVQFIILAPVIYGIIKKYGSAGMVFIGLINLAYEIFWIFAPLPEGLYRIIFLRYLLVVSFGMYMALFMDKIETRNAVIWGIVGAIYILLPYFTQYEYKIFVVEPWNRSGMISGFYVAAVMYFIFKRWHNARERGFLVKVIGSVGRASYHIMYTQMIYFELRPATDKLLFDITNLPLWSQYIVDIVVCVVTGLVFCMSDNKIFGKFYKTK